MNALLLTLVLGAGPVTGDWPPPPPAAPDLDARAPLQVTAVPVATAAPATYRVLSSPPVFYSPPLQYAAPVQYAAPPVFYPAVTGPPVTTPSVRYSGGYAASPAGTCATGR